MLWVGIVFSGKFVLVAIMMNQAIIIEHKNFNFEHIFLGNVKLLKITERRKGLVSLIRFKANLVSWLCTVID